MKNDERLLRKIIEHCDGIEEAVVLFGRDEEDFLGNKIYQKSCIFDIFQIGETVKLLSFGLTNSHPNVPWKEIAGFRDIIAHDYESVRLEDTWITVIKEVPELKDICERILTEIDTV